jgi:lipopolysaccharide transport system ATP-binding protein
MPIVLRIDNIWKHYRLGVIGYGTLYRDLQSWWARLRGREDPNSPIRLQCEEASISGGMLWALQSITLDVEEGEIVGIIGRNGAGKSTLLKIISRVTAPTKGEIKIRGRVASLLEVGTGFHSELTGRENIFLNGTIHGMRIHEIERKFDEIVDFSGVEKFIDTPVKRYSSGMYVRLAFAVAAYLEPEILVVDEVLAVGDAEFQKKCLGKMGDVAKEGRTVLIVSHQMHLITRLCQRAVLLQDGRLVSIDQAPNVVETYLKVLNPSDSEVVDLTSRPKSGPVTDGIRLLSAHFLTGLPVTYGSRVEIKITFEIVKPVDYAELGLSIRTQDDIYISSIASGDAGGPVLESPVVGKAYSVVIRIPQWRWPPRVYILGAGIRSAPTIAEDRVDVGTFEVLGDSNDPSSFEGRWDYYRPCLDFEYSQ